MLYSQYSKFGHANAVDFMIDYALGCNKLKSIRELSHWEAAQSSSYHLFMSHDGIVKSIKGLEQIEKMDNVIIDIPKRKDREVKQGTHFGVLRIYSKDTNHLIDTLKFINEVLRVEDEYKKDLLIHYTDYKTLVKESDLGAKQFNVKATPNLKSSSMSGGGVISCAPTYYGFYSREVA